MKCDKCQNKAYCDEHVGIRRICKRNGYNGFVMYTNGDAIRSMNNYDLADWIAKILIYHGKVALNEYHVDCDKSCPLYYCCNDQPTDNIEGWLDLPAEEDET